MYGTFQTDFYPDKGCSVKRSNNYPGGFTSSTLTFDVSAYFRRKESRSGTNRVKGLKSSALPPKTPIYVVRRVKGVKVLSRRTGTRFKKRRVLVRTITGFRTHFEYDPVSYVGKPYFKRIPLFIKRVQFVKSKQASSRPDYRPNSLSYQKDVVYVTGSPFVSETFPGDARFNRTYSGDLHTSWQTLTNHTAVVSPGAYLDVSSAGVTDALEKVSDEALKRFYGSIHDQRVHLGNLIAELDKSLTMVRDLSFRLANGLIALARKDFFGAAKHLLGGDWREIPSQYLLYKFGVEPLVKDLQEIATVLVEGYRFITTAKGSCKTKQTTTLQDLTVYGVHRTVTEEVEVTVKYACQVEVTSAYTKAASSFGVGQILETGWELIPNSFLVDWVLPVGQYLASLSATDGLKTMHPYKTTFIRRTVRASHEFVGLSPSGYYWDGQTTGWVLEQVSVKRELLTDLPDFPFTLNRSSQSLTHLAELLSVLSSFKR